MLTVTCILTNTPLWVFPLLAYLIWQGSQSLRPRNAADLADADRAAGVRRCLPCWRFPQAKTARGGQKKRHRDPSGQRHPTGSQPHGVRAAIRCRGGDGHEARTSCRRGDHRPRRLRRQRGLLFRPGGGAGAPLQKFRRGRKFWRTRDRWRVETDPLRRRLPGRGFFSSQPAGLVHLRARRGRSLPKARVPG